MKHQASGMRARTEKRFGLRIEKHTVGVAKRARRLEPDGAAGAHSDLAAALPSPLLLPEWLDAAAISIASQTVRSQGQASLLQHRSSGPRIRSSSGRTA
jgi:hypothetical protein